MASPAAVNCPSGIAEQKKRALEALELRFATLAKPEHASKQQKKDPRSVCQRPKTPVSAALDSKKSLSVRSSNRGDGPSYEDIESHPVYLELFPVVHDNLTKPSVEGSSKKDVVNRVLEDIIGSGELGSRITKGATIINKEHQFPLDNFISKSRVLKEAQEKALKRQSKRSQKRMSMRQHRKFGSFDLPKEFHKFELFEPMHETWKHYIGELIKDTGKGKQLSQLLLQADLHGAFLRVVECKRNSAFKDMTGISIQETSETFGVITRENQFHVVPKRGSLFMFQAGCWKITLDGDKRLAGC